jgi:hypothetical protein
MVLAHELKKGRVGRRGRAALLLLRCCCQSLPIATAKRHVGRTDAAMRVFGLGFPLTYLFFRCCFSAEGVERFFLIHWLLHIYDLPPFHGFLSSKLISARVLLTQWSRLGKGHDTRLCMSTYFSY